ncbi:hypothetical protein DRT62_16715 [Salmonella enterica subsp. enterica serovar Saintpaul]|uniref:Uncharacterized protein n=1 Tax=Salmonella enterica subsp. enterica serovar Saintpaul TaxID=90105 RepID=A0A5U9I5Q3_SALET|nr:hypothetical protein [Salmonella enterica]EBS2301351.1 hypothetical protein [Salmonella enterica subsp. enterica serovar Saintpaul]ECA8470414.1 hypothetical protein [Salmonella enterica subsp. enterica serovar Saintpaul]EME4112298.1 hypothetical protein [Salmonella enterica]MEN56040.1 hypothetical protein [Salmonella enterica]
MTKKQTTITAFLIGLSALVGYEVGLSNVANFAHDEITIIRKNLNPLCFYEIHQSTLIAVCPQ